MKTMAMRPTTSAEPRIVKRPAEERGRSEFGWLHSRHSFSFGSYFDSDHMGFRSLRVINDDIVAAGAGFGEHPHRDAEIFSYVISGALEHRDSMGNGRIIQAGDLQYMSAGSGVLHSEFNPSPKEPVHFLQVWLKPRMNGGTPRYAELAIGRVAKPDSLTLVLSGHPVSGAIETRADADVHLGQIHAGKKLVHVPSPGRGQWLHLISGEVAVAGESLKAGDGAAFENFTELGIEGKADAQFFLFDLN